MYRALRNVRVNHITYEKGKDFESLPEGYEKYFIRIGEEKIETAQNVHKSEKRSKKDGRANKRTSNTGRS
jgi:hypothetical protein